MKVDLHCHTHYSDGKHSPEYLFARARENQLTHLAITDHDCIAAFNVPQPNPEDLQLVPGVEISCDWSGKEIHILGLCIDPQESSLVRLLENQQLLRRERMLAMDKLLVKLGIAGLMDYLEQLPCVAYTRSHAADFLVQVGASKNRQKAFKKYLAKRGRCYVEANWCSLKEAVYTINQAGGIASVAHPGRYPLGKAKLEQLLEDFKEAGGEAVEVSYSNIDSNTKSRLCELAESKNLFLTVGSDFHDSEAHWTRLGKFPALAEQAKKNAIWNHPRWHF